MLATVHSQLGYQLAMTAAPLLCTAALRALPGLHGGAQRHLHTTLPSSRPAAQPALAAADEALCTAPPPRFNPDAPHAPAASPAAALAAAQPPAPLHFTAVNSQTWSRYPDAAWSKLVSLFGARRQLPVAVDVAVGAEGTAGVELAKRGFKVLSVASDRDVLVRTYARAAACNAALELIPAAAACDVVHSGSVDLVTFMHGMHLLDAGAAAKEAYRILKPGGRLVLGVNDRDLGCEFVQGLESAMERWVPGYARAARQHGPRAAALALTLQQSGRWRLAESLALSNPLVVRNLATLSDVLNCQAGVREALRGAERKGLNTQVRDLVEARFGQGAVLLPMVARIFVLEKL